MAINMLAGSGPSMQTGGNAAGPSPGLQGTLGATPQASPTPQGQNMLAGGGGGQAAPQQAPIAPPSLAKLQEAYHKQGYVVSALKELLGKPDLSTKDVLNEVGEAVADQIMGPFDAAGYLKDLPPNEDPMALRQWVGQHYSNAMQAFETVSHMLEAHGQMMRRGAMGMAPVQSQMQNAMTPQAMGG